MAGKPRSRRAQRIGVTCGARTRAGCPCQSRVIYRNGRCRNHGGLSTGARTAEGRERANAARQAGLGRYLADPANRAEFFRRCAEGRRLARAHREAVAEEERRREAKRREGQPVGGTHTRSNGAGAARIFRRLCGSVPFYSSPTVRA